MGYDCMAQNTEGITVKSPLPHLLLSHLILPSGGISVTSFQYIFKGAPIYI